MAKKRYLLMLVLAIIVVIIAACTGAVPAPSTGGEEAAPAAAGEEMPCDFDQQTCDFLKGKDFSGQTLVVGVWGGVIEEILRDIVIPPLEARGATVELLLGGTGDRLAKIYAEKGNPTMG